MQQIRHYLLFDKLVVIYTHISEEKGKSRKKCWALQIINKYYIQFIMYKRMKMYDMQFYDFISICTWN